MTGIIDQIARVNGQENQKCVAKCKRLNEQRTLGEKILVKAGQPKQDENKYRE